MVDPLAGAVLFFAGGMVGVLLAWLAWGEK
jgi:hypothetical protein